jgi:hypothetical protein
VQDQVSPALFRAACLSGGTPSAPIYPLALSIVQMGQNVVSSVFIFPFLLGVRNHFRIK